MPPHDPLPCIKHGMQIEDLSRRVEKLEDREEDTRTRQVRLETQAERGADLFGRYLWPVLMIVITAILTHYLKR